MPAETSIAMSPELRRDLSEPRLPLPLRISLPWPIRRVFRFNHVTLLLRIALGAEVVGTVAGDDTVLIICPDVRHAGVVEARIRTLLES